MKRLLLTMGFAALAGLAFSQNAYDGLRLSQTNPVLGTARYTGMAGAFTALGGNSSAIKDNPAALGVYRSKELTFSPSIYINNNGDVKAALDNFAFILNFGSKKNKHGYITSSLGINYNRLNNYSRYTRQRDERTSVSLTDKFGNAGPDNLHYGYATEVNLLDENGYSIFGTGDVLRKYTLMEKGHVGQWDFAYGLNISNLVYVGAAFGINTIEYKQTAVYDESTLPSEPEDHWYMDNYYDARAHGFNFRIGAIVRPIDEVRIGASFETPTFYDITDYAKLELGSDGYNPVIDDYGGDFFYEFRTPLKFKTGVGFVIGKKALVDIDYQFENFKKIRMKADDIEIDDVSDVAEDQMNQVHTIKAGAELQVVDGFFLRLGTAFSSSPIETEEAENTLNFRIITLPQQSIYVTGGAGYKGEHFYCDLAYAFHNEKSVLYPSLPLGATEFAKKENLKTRNIIATFGWRF